MIFVKRIITVAVLCALPHVTQADSAIFFHPDGMGVNQWNAVRAMKTGPDGTLEWDKLPHVAIYKGHLTDRYTSSSHGGATVHAYGIKVPRDSYGIMDSGKQSIAHMALKRGKAVGLVNSGTITEPGTGVFVARVEDRDNHSSIAQQILASGAQVILGGGEQWFLPQGEAGRHGVGKRKDGLNLIEQARQQGYYIVYDAKELMAVDVASTPKLLGLFAASHTFNDKSMEKLKQKKLPLFKAGAPTIAQMTQQALALLQHHHKDNFLLIAEEEGTDNFGNVTNPHGVIEAGIRADDAIGVIRKFMVNHPNATMIMTSDSDAGGMQFYDCTKQLTKMLRQDRCDGDASFMAQPDRRGVQHTINVGWVSRHDVHGGIVVRGAGKQAQLIRGTMDNTKIFTVLKSSLFGNGNAN